MKPNKTQNIFRIILVATLLLTAIGHFTVLLEWQSQLLDWLPLDKNLLIILSGVVELILGLALLFMSKYRVYIGYIIAGFFILIFPINIEQYINKVDFAGLNSDTSRFVRLLFQPVLIAWALWCTGAWKAKSKS